MVQWAVIGIKFLYFYGVYFTVGVDQEHFLVFETGSELAQFAMGFGDIDYYFLKVNLIPLIPLAILRWCERNPAKDPLEDFLAEEEPVQ